MIDRQIKITDMRCCPLCGRKEDHEHVYGETDKRFSSLFHYEAVANIIGLSLITGNPPGLPTLQVPIWKEIMAVAGGNADMYRKNLVLLLIMRDLIACGFGGETAHRVSVDKDIKGFKFINLKKGLLQIQVNVIAYEAEINRRISEWNTRSGT